MAWKVNFEETLDRHRRFFRREMLDGILVNLESVRADTEDEWVAFEKKWGTYGDGDTRPFPSNEEIFEHAVIGLEETSSRIRDDSMRVIYPTMDIGEAMVRGFFGKPMRFMHRVRGPAYSGADAVLSDYPGLPELEFSLDNEWVRRCLSIEEYFARHANGRFFQHPCLTMDALNFACEIRDATPAYTDIYAQPDELRSLMEIGLDFNIRFQEAQRKIIDGYADGCFVWLGGWAPFPKAVALSVDAYVVCSVQNYVDFGFEYQSRLIERLGHGLMHFHCNRTDLAAQVAKLPNLVLFQYGGDMRDPVSAIDRLPEMRRAVGGVPMMVDCEPEDFCSRLSKGTLMPNVWYDVWTRDPDKYLSIDEANRLMEKVRAYRA